MRVSMPSMVITLLLLSLVAGATSMLTEGGLQKQNSHGRVVGTIFDPSEAVIPDVTVILTGKRISLKVQTNSEGKYEAELPAGIYQISIKAQGLLPYRRASFRVHPDQTVLINVAPAISEIPLCVLYVGPPQKAPRFSPDKPLKYDAFRIANADKSSMEMLIEFKKRRANKGFIEYNRASLTYDSLFVSGDKIRFNKQKGLIEAKGNVVLEDGSQRTKHSFVIVKLENSTPKIKFS